MIKIDTNGSGVQVIIRGCPFCDGEGTEHLRYHLSQWTIDPNMDADHYSFSIKHCPACGELLPSLIGWKLESSENRLKADIEETVEELYEMTKEEIEEFLDSPQVRYAKAARADRIGKLKAEFAGLESQCKKGLYD